MPVIEEISRMSKGGCDDKELLEYVYDNYDEIECELNGDEYKEPKKHNRNLCIDCNIEMTIDYQKPTLVCTNCGLSQPNQVFVTSYNHTMQPLKRKCVYKRSDNFKVIIRQFFYGGKKLVPDEVIRDEIHENILYNYTISITIPILECILKRNELMIYKDSINFIFLQIKWSTLPTYHNKRI